MSALTAALLAAALAGGCPPTQAQQLAHDATIVPLGVAGGRRVVLASLEGACICGNVNCPYVVLRIGTNKADELLDTYAYEVRPIGPAAPLPNLRELAHDSALVSDETIDAYRNGKYVAISTARIRGDNGDRKLNAVPVRFLPGTSSAVLRGNVSLGWYDEYELSAEAGQRLTLTGVRAAGPLTFSLLGPKSTPALGLRPGVPVVLPAGGSYLLQIDGSGDDAQAYLATVRIR